MKKFLLICIAFCTSSLWSQNQWHVRPYTDNYTNPSGADGTSFATAWCLQFALSGAGGAIHAGDTVWLHGDPKPTYNGSPTSAAVYKGHFTSSLLGTETDYIIVKSYPGEWAVIDGNIYDFEPEDKTSACDITGIINETLETDSEELVQGPPSEIELDFINEDEIDPSLGRILSITGAYVQYMDFEITCLPLSETEAVNRVREDCNENSPFHKMTGVYHNPSKQDWEENRTKNFFINLVIRNIPGTGIGSWKYAADSEIYGCIVYNNGYIKYECTPDTNGRYWIYGKGPGIYTQNTTDVNRQIENNIFVNNYDNAIELWSATEVPDEEADYVKNYELKNNIFINNGNPGRRHYEGSISHGNDSKPNLLVSSASTVPGANTVKNITVDKNYFYLNSLSSISGLRVTNADGVEIKNNYFFKGAKCAQLYKNNTNITFENNVYWGKYLEVQDSITRAGVAFNNFFNLNNNRYYTRYLQMVETAYYNPSVSRKTIPEFQTQYNTEINSYRYAITDAGPSKFKPNPNTNPPPFPFSYNISQNKYNPNLFYVVVFNPNSTSTTTNIPVNFSSYSGLVGKNYIIRDVQNYYGTIPNSSDTYSGGNINFSLTNTSIELPIGFYDYCPTHSQNDFASYTIEFLCPDVEDIKIVDNYTDNTTSTILYEAKSHLTLGANYIAGSSAGVLADVTAKAGKSIVIKPNSIVYYATNFLAKIENICQDAVCSVCGSSRLPIVNSFSSLKQQKSTPSNQESFLRIHPNPVTNGVLYIDSSNSAEKSIIIYDLLGKQVLNTTATNTVNVASLKSGMYILKITEAGKTSTSKLVIK